MKYPSLVTKTTTTLAALLWLPVGVRGLCCRDCSNIDLTVTRENGVGCHYHSRCDDLPDYDLCEFEEEADLCCIRNNVGCDLRYDYFCVSGYTEEKCLSIPGSQTEKSWCPLSEQAACSYCSQEPDCSNGCHPEWIYSRDNCLLIGWTWCPETSSGGFGDPHFVLWNGEFVEYQGACDLILVQAPAFEHGLGLEIHVRTKIRYEYSYIESAALRIGQEVLEVGSFGEYFVNGVDNAKLPAMLAGYAVSHNQPEVSKHVFDVKLSEREHIVISSFKDMVSVKVENSTAASFGSSAGLLGSYISGELLARDGKTVLQDPIEFGQEWQVLDSEPKLFQNVDHFPQYPEKCVLPTPHAGETSNARRLGESSISIDDAKEACLQHWGDNQGMMDACVQDTMATGDLEVARAGAF